MKKVLILLMLLVIFMMVSCDGEDIGDACSESNKFCHYHDGLNWSDSSSSTMNWYSANAYCKDLGGRLPTISELRTLIKNCPGSETGGECGVVDDCLSFTDCRNDACNGCADVSDGRYSKLGDTDWFWSSSEISDFQGFAWLIYFLDGHVDEDDKGNISINVRCVK